MDKVITSASLNAQTAHRLVELVCRYADQKNWKVSVAVVDPHGEVIAVLRSDGVIAEGTRFAIDKAYTAARLDRSTEDLWQACEEKAFLQAGLSNRERILVFPGGLPIYHENVLVGAIGVSGAASAEDIEAARYALAELGLETMA